MRKKKKKKHQDDEEEDEEEEEEEEEEEGGGGGGGGGEGGAAAATVASDLVSECPTIAWAVYRQRQDGVAKVVQWNVCKQYGSYRKNKR